MRRRFGRLPIFFPCAKRAARRRSAIVGVGAAAAAVVAGIGLGSSCRCCSGKSLDPLEHRGGDGDGVGGAVLSQADTDCMVLGGGLGGG